MVPVWDIDRPDPRRGSGPVGLLVAVDHDTESIISENGKQNAA